MNKHRVKRIIGYVILAIVGIYIVAAIILIFTKVVDNPPVNGVVNGPPDAIAILKRSCFDCHSNETHIGWFQRLPIVSSVVASDVKGARSIINFTEWNKYTPVEQDGIIYLAVNAVESGSMPPGNFTFIHPHTKITAEDQIILKQWLQSLK